MRKPDGISLPDSAHPLVVATAREVHEAQTVNGALWLRSSRSLDVRVAPQRVRRALLLFDAIIRGGEQRGIRFSISHDYRTRTEATLEGITNYVVVRESFKESPRTERRGYDWAPTGSFLLLLENDLGRAIARFPDGKRQKVEKKVTAFIDAIVRRARQARNRHEQFELERQAIAAAMERRAAEERARELEIKRRVELVGEARRYEDSLAVRRYLAALEDAVSPMESKGVHDAITAWLEWAEHEVQLIDPLPKRLHTPTA